MFSIQRVGERITEWRKARHMTQQELADKMHVSFQAVSNWERGISMPDISKLPELAKILEVSIDRILAEDDIPVSPLSKNQTETTLPSCIVIPEADMPPVTVQAPRQAVSLPAPTPASPPDMPVDMQNLAGLVEIAPFLEQETLDQIALEIGQHPSPSDDFDILTALAPFISGNVLSTIALHMVEQEGKIPDLGLLMGLAPFLEEDVTGRMALHIIKNRPFQEDINLQILSGLAPFLEEETMGTIVDILLSRNTPMDGNLLQQLAPFLPEEAINKIARQLFRQRP